MSHADPQRDSGPVGAAAKLLAAAGIAAVLAASGGCQTDSFLDPSKVGRWEHTPAVMPILKRIAAIEGPEDEFVEITEPNAQDLIPEAREYRIGPGDQLAIRLWDVPDFGRETEYFVVVDARGMIFVPQLGELNVNGQSVVEARETLIRGMSRLIEDEAEASVQVAQPRQLRYTVVGAVGGPGAYFLPEADYKLTDALAAAGWFREETKEVFVIRQVSLAETMTRPDPAPQEDPDEDLLDVIDDLTRPPGSPSALGPAGGNPPPAPPAARRDPEPTLGAMSAGRTSWMYLNGRWVQVSRRNGQPDAERLTPEMLRDEPLENLVTQRVIRIPVKRLLAGDARMNIVVRAGDIIRVPSPPAGFVYLDGEIARGGAFGMAPDLTLTRVIASAGGLGTLAIPERVDLTRMVGDDRQGTIRINYRAIAEGTQQDILLKPNDRIVIGTNFWAYPLAVIRNGFRASYGFGFLLDRNFGNDVFGAPPTRVQGR